MTVEPEPPPLAPIVDDFRSELDQIESVFQAVAGTDTVDGYRLSYAPAEDGCVVSLWDSWNRFMRCLLLACSAGSVESLSGTLYTPSVLRGSSAALHHIGISSPGTKVKVVRGEPLWYSIPVIIDLVEILSLSNGTSIVGAVTATDVHLGVFTIRNPLEHIRVCRNFIAHKCDATLADITGHATGGLVDLRRYVRGKEYGVELFSAWKDGCVAIASAAAS